MNFKLLKEMMSDVFTPTFSRRKIKYKINLSYLRERALLLGPYFQLETNQSSSKEKKKKLFLQYFTVL